MHYLGQQMILSACQLISLFRSHGRQDTDAGLLILSQCIQLLLYTQHTSHTLFDEILKFAAVH